MATIPPGQRVHLAPSWRARLRYPPPGDGALYVVPNPAALNAPAARQTQVVCIHDDAVTWAGALDERMLEVAPEVHDEPRYLFCGVMLRGTDLWNVVFPGGLTRQAGPLLTVYAGDRPWVVIGELESGDRVAAPLNDARGNPKWYAPIVPAASLDIPGTKESQLELAHVWSLPVECCEPVAVLSDAGVLGRLQEAIRRYF